MTFFTRSTPTNHHKCPVLHSEPFGLRLLPSHESLASSSVKLKFCSAGHFGGVLTKETLQKRCPQLPRAEAMGGDESQPEKATRERVTQPGRMPPSRPVLLRRLTRRPSATLQQATWGVWMTSRYSSSMSSLLSGIDCFLPSTPDRLARLLPRVPLAFAADDDQPPRPAAGGSPSAHWRSESRVCRRCRCRGR